MPIAAILFLKAAMQHDARPTDNSHLEREPISGSNIGDPLYKDTTYPDSGWQATALGGAVNGTPYYGKKAEIENNKPYRNIFTASEWILNHREPELMEGILEHSENGFPMVVKCEGYEHSKETVLALLNCALLYGVKLVIVPTEFARTKYARLPLEKDVGEEGRNSDEADVS